MNDESQEHLAPAGGDTAARVVTNSLWLFGAEALAKVLALLTQVVAARYLGEAGFGVFTFAFSLTGTLTVFIDTGLGLYLTREVSVRPERAHLYLKNVFALKAGLSLLTVILLAVGLRLSGLSAQAVSVALLIGLALMVHGYTDMILAVFRAFEEMARVSVLTVVARVLFFALGLAVLLSGADVVGFSAAFFFAACISLVLAVWQLHRHHLFPSAAAGGRRLREILKQAAPVCGVVLFTYICFRIDAVLVFFFIGETETGRYAAAFKLVEALSLLMASVRLALYPVLSRSFKNDPAASARLWEQSARYLLLLTVPLAAGMALCAAPIVDLVYGERYAGAGVVLAVMALGFPFLCLNDLAASLLVSGHRTHSVLKAAGACALLSPLALALAIPRWGVMGAAAVAAGTQCVLFAVYLPMLRGFLGGAPFFRIAWKPVIASAAMAALLLAVEFLLLGIRVVLAAGVYAVGLWLLKAFDASDRAVLKKIVNR